MPDFDTPVPNATSPPREDGVEIDLDNDLIDVAMGGAINQKFKVVTNQIFQEDEEKPENLSKRKYNTLQEEPVKFFGRKPPTEEELNDWIEHGYLDTVANSVFPFYNQKISEAKKHDEDFEQYEKDRQDIYNRTRKNLNYKLTHPDKMTNEEKEHFIKWSQKCYKTNRMISLDERQMSALVNSTYNMYKNAGILHMPSDITNEQKQMFEARMKSHLTEYYSNLQNNGLNALVNQAYEVATGESRKFEAARAEIIHNWKKETNENYSDTILQSMGIKSLIEDKVVTTEPEKKLNTDSIEDAVPAKINKQDIKNESANEKTEVKKNEADKISELQKAENAYRSKLIAESDIGLSEDVPSDLDFSKIFDDDFEPGDKVLTESETGDKVEDTVVAVNTDSPNKEIITETGEKFAGSDSRVEKKYAQVSDNVKQQSTGMSNEEYRQLAGEAVIKAHNEQAPYLVMEKVLNKYDGKYIDGLSFEENMVNAFDVAGFTVLREQWPGEEKGEMGIRVEIPDNIDGDLNNLGTAIFSIKTNSDIKNAESVKKNLQLLMNREKVKYDKAEINLKAEKEALKAKKDGLKETQTKNNISVKNQRLAI